MNVGRRSAVIAAVGVAEYARLLKADKAGTLEMFKKHNEALYPLNVRHSGEFLGAASDGFLLSFPSVTGAVNYSVEMNALMVERNADVPEDKKIRCTVGIDYGEIVIDGLDVDGDGVKVAEHLQALAGPGGVCISGTARDKMRDSAAIQFEDLGEVEVTNIAEPVRALRVLVEGMEAGRVSPKPARPNWRIAATAIALVILLLGAGFVLW